MWSHQGTEKAARGSERHRGLDTCQVPKATARRLRSLLPLVPASTLDSVALESTWSGTYMNSCWVFCLLLPNSTWRSEPSICG